MVILWSLCWVCSYTQRLSVPLTPVLTGEPSTHGPEPWRIRVPDVLDLLLQPSAVSHCGGSVLSARGQRGSHAPCEAAEHLTCSHHDRELDS